MANEGSAQFGVTISAEDKTGPALASASTGIKELENKSKSLQDNVKQMPEKFAKASSAMMVFGGATSQMGGEIGMAAGKLSQLGALVAGGGLFGVAMAGTTVAIGAFSLAMEKVTESTRQAEEEAKKAIETKKIEKVALDEMNKTLLGYQQAIEDVGKTQRQISIENAERQLVEMRRLVEFYNIQEQMANTAMIALADEGNEKWRQSADAARGFAIELEAANKKLEMQYQIVDSIKELGAAEQDYNTKKESAAKNDSQLVANKQTAIKMLDDEIARWEKLPEAIKATDNYKDQIAGLQNWKAEVENKNKVTASEIEWIKQTKEANNALYKDQEQLGKDAAENALVQQGKIALASKARLSMIEKEADLFEEKAKQKDQIMQQQQAQQAQAAAQMGQAMGTMFAQMVVDGKNAHIIMARQVVQMAKMVVMAAAAKAAAESGASAAILGPFAAASAAAVTFGIIEALLAKIPEAAVGGRVRGGQMGTDSIPVMIQQGEGILNVRQMKLFDRMVGAMDKMMGGAVGPQVAFAGAGGGNVVVNYNRRTITPGSSTQTSREIRELTRAANKLKNRGIG